MNQDNVSLFNLGCRILKTLSADRFLFCLWYIQDHRLAIQPIQWYVVQKKYDVRKYKPYMVYYPDCQASY